MRRIVKAAVAFHRDFFFPADTCRIGSGASFQSGEEAAKVALRTPQPPGQPDPRSPGDKQSPSRRRTGPGNRD